MKTGRPWWLNRWESDEDWRPLPKDDNATIPPDILRPIPPMDKRPFWRRLLSSIRGNVQFGLTEDGDGQRIIVKEASIKGGTKF
jgi:hypothetical protein